MNVTRNETHALRRRPPYSTYPPHQLMALKGRNFKQNSSFEVQRFGGTPSKVTPSSLRRINKKNYLSTTSSSGHPFSTPSDRRTPRSTTSSAESDSSCIVAISEGRGQARGEVGIAAVDIHRPHLILSQFSDGQSYINTLTKLHILNPIEVLLPHTFCDTRTPSKIFMVLREQCSRLNVTCVQRRHFNESNGRLLINLLCALEYSSVELLLTHKFYALSAAAALLKYVEYIQNLIFAPKSLKIEYQGSQNTTVIDVDTATRLELVASLAGNLGEAKAWSQKRKLWGVNESKPSLLSILNNCRTMGGLRLLRATILQPPCLLSVIDTRLESVTELATNVTLAQMLGSVLGQLSEVEQLLTLCMVSPDGGERSGAEALLRLAETRINYALLLKTSLNMVPPLLEALKEASTPHLRGICKSLDDAKYVEMLQQIDEVLHDDARTTKGFASSHLQRCFAVRPGINGLLDVARKTYSEIVGDITVYVGELAEEHRLNLRVNYTAARGFHIQLIPMDNTILIETELPPEFIQVQRGGRSLTFVTQELIEYDMRCKVALQEIQAMSNVIIMELLGKLREGMASLYKLCDAVANLDMLLSLAQVSSLKGYCRPCFNESLNVIKGRHPLLDFFGSREPVPNDVYASSYFNFHVVTGPNMSGKSIYIKMIALLQIMAQIGCYVPAERASFRIADHIFSRIGFDDSIECNASTFVLELKEMQYIMQYITAKSLVIVDELCRGTSVEEGTSMAWAFSEELFKTNAFVFLTTHFHFLTKLASIYPNVTNHHLRTEEQEVTECPVDTEEVDCDQSDPRVIRSRLHYTHRLEPGVTTVENYGLRLAEVSGLPPSVIAEAKNIHSVISNARKPLPGVEGGENGLEYKAHQLVGEVLHLADNMADSLTLEENNEAVKKETFLQLEKIMQQMDELGPLPSFPESIPDGNQSENVVEHSHISHSVNNEIEAKENECETVWPMYPLEENCYETPNNFQPLNEIRECESETSSLNNPNDDIMTEFPAVECEVIITEG